MIKRGDWQELVDQIHSPLAVTIASTTPLPLDAIHRCADRFFNLIERRALGARWHRKPTYERLRAVGFVEHLESNTHMHLAVEAPCFRLQSVLVNGKGIWRRVRPGGTYDCAPAKGRWSAYITKDAWGLNAPDRLYLRCPRL